MISTSQDLASKHQGHTESFTLKLVSHGLVGEGPFLRADSRGSGVPGCWQWRVGFLGAGSHRPPRLPGRVWRGGSSASEGSPGVKGPPAPGEQFKVDKLAGPSAHWSLRHPWRSEHVCFLSTEILLSWTRSFRPHSRGLCGPCGCVPAPRRGFHPTEGSGCVAAKQRKELILGRRESTYHLVRSPG